MDIDISFLSRIGIPFAGTIYKDVKDRANWTAPEGEVRPLGFGDAKSFPTAYEPLPGKEIARLCASFKWGGMLQQPLDGDLILRQEVLHFGFHLSRMNLWGAFGGALALSEEERDATLRRIVSWKVPLSELASFDVSGGFMFTNVTVRTTGGGEQAFRVLPNFKNSAREFREIVLKTKAS